MATSADLGDYLARLKDERRLVRERIEAQKIELAKLQVAADALTGQIDEIQAFLTWRTSQPS
jgi:hypothetical protein